ncbi:MAG: sigma-70 family RNA polymerase sigma factor [Chitinophagaceae bacterium]|nr:MAG: sigma-70 family RNA polymerase sigma factor [Chitinophagaceae bacterium]
MRELQSNTPPELIRQLAEGSQAALAGIIALCKPGMLRLISIYTPDTGLAQEIFLDVMQTLWEKRKWVARLDNPYTWLLRVARNKTLNRIRDTHHVPIVALEKAWLLPDKTEVGNSLDAADVEHFINISTSRLSPREKQVFELSIRYGWNTKAIAGELRISDSTVRSQLSNALKKIRAALSFLQRMVII